jgi:hypothetical protein
MAGKPEVSQLANLEQLKKVAMKLINQRYFKGKNGGGGQSRTVDAADMSRVL